MLNVKFSTWLQWSASLLIKSVSDSPITGSERLLHSLLVTPPLVNDEQILRSPLAWDSTALSWWGIRFIPSLLISDSSAPYSKWGTLPLTKDHMVMWPCRHVNVITLSSRHIVTSPGSWSWGHREHKVLTPKNLT